MSYLQAQLGRSILKFPLLAGLKFLTSFLVLAIFGYFEESNFFVSLTKSFLDFGREPLIYRPSRRVQFLRKKGEWDSDLKNPKFPLSVFNDPVIVLSHIPNLHIELRAFQKILKFLCLNIFGSPNHFLFSESKNI